MALELKAPNAKEISIWNRARKNFDVLSRRIALTRIRLQYASIVADHAVAHGVNVALSSSNWFQSMSASVDAALELAEKIGTVMDAAELGTLATRPTTDGQDLDVIAPAPLPEKWLPYQINAGDVPKTPELGNPLIILGIIVAVVIGGIFTTTSLTKAYISKVDSDVELATLEAEKLFCADPNSEVCKGWIKKKASKPAKESLSAIDYLLGKGSGKAFAGGVGILFALGLGWWILSRKRAK